MNCFASSPPPPTWSILFSKVSALPAISDSQAIPRPQSISFLLRTPQCSVPGPLWTSVSCPDCPSPWPADPVLAHYTEDSHKNTSENISTVEVMCCRHMRRCSALNLTKLGQGWDSTLKTTHKICFCCC